MEIPTKNSDKGQQTKMLLKMGFTTYIFQAIFSTFQLLYELFPTLTAAAATRNLTRILRKKTK